MSQPTGRPATQRTPLNGDEKRRAVANFVPYVTEVLVARGRFRVSADSPDMVEVFQQVARSAGDALGRPVVSYANGREIVITFGAETASLVP
jgi:hypothetical protein